jgi:hypothetical protein|tara:strand:+ start:1489 stop:1689 length:201 start_codon:yes stop_codon:yes gene_type:complete
MKDIVNNKTTNQNCPRLDEGVELGDRKGTWNDLFFRMIESIANPRRNGGMMSNIRANRFVVNPVKK